MIQHKHAAVVRGWHARFLQGTVMPRAATTAATRSMHAQANISLRRQSIGTAAAAAAAAAAAEHGDSTSLIQHHHHTLAYLRLPKSAHERLSDNDSRCSGPHDNERLLRKWLVAGAAAPSAASAAVLEGVPVVSGSSSLSPAEDMRRGGEGGGGEGQDGGVSQANEESSRGTKAGRSRARR